MNMIELPYRISKKVLYEHPELFFIYGHDVDRKGTFGQAWSVHGEKNTAPVYTCWKMCKSSGYFSDTQYEDICSINNMAIKQIVEKAKSRPIIPLRKIGQGYSRMNEFAPRAFAYLMKELDRIKYPNIKWKYE